jgi:uncharacterized protein (DUF2236 family)
VTTHELITAASEDPQSTPARIRRPSDAIADRLGLYGPESEAWRLNREAVLLLGAGPRALLLQIAHPLVAEGVDQHSDFRADPWARLQGTLRSYLRIVYGTGAAARAEIRRLNELHRTIEGPIRDVSAAARHGAAYSARDPELSLWVHATLVDSTIVAADAWLEPMDRERRSRYYAETLPIGRAFGIPARLLPPTYDAFEGYLSDMLAARGPIQVGPTARELARNILHPPLAPIIPALGAVPRALYDWTLWPAVGLLPARVREGFDLAWGTRERLVSAWLVAGWRAWRPLLPRTFRQMPQALAADRRSEGLPRADTQ